MLPDVCTFIGTEGLPAMGDKCPVVRGCMYLCSRHEAQSVTHYQVSKQL